jgi:hypothetical protein
MSKRKLPELLRVRGECRRQVGVEPFKPESPDQKRKIQACVELKVGKKK